MSKKNNDSRTSSFLPEEVAKQYEPAEGTVAQIFSSQFGLVDLSKIDLEFAERLAQAGILKNLS